MRMASLGSAQDISDFQKAGGFQKTGKRTGETDTEQALSPSSSQETITPLNWKRKQDWLDSALDEFAPSLPASGESTPLARVISGIELTQAGRRQTESGASGSAFQAIIRRTLDRLHESAALPPQERVEKTRTRKVAAAERLADWMRDTLNESGVQVAVVARQGGLQHQKHDPTGMFHSGIALFHPDEKKWKIYNLVDEPAGGRWHCEVQWAEPEDFFYQQGGYRQKALMLVPDPATQQTMHHALLKGDYRKLLFTQHYNLVSEPGSKTSLNCNKWVLLNVLAAKRNQYNPMPLLDELREQYQPGRIDVHPLVRPIARYGPHLKPDEVPLWGPIHTVTVNSLQESGLFERTLSCDEPENEPKAEKLPSEGHLHGRGSRQTPT